MKKYLVSLIPVVFCTILSFIYGVKTPKDYPDPSYPYQTKATFSYLSTGWFYIGIIVTGIFISMFIINDVVDYVAKAMEKKRMDKHSKQGRNPTRRRQTGGQNPPPLRPHAVIEKNVELLNSEKSFTHFSLHALDRAIIYDMLHCKHKYY